ncbi:MAG: hypothetical protein K2I92_07740 [Muribaculaceae bacterium]|nr:hypothetical protein [Muribaculaceae bacterium]
MKSMAEAMCVWRISGGALLFLLFTWILPKSFETRQKIDGKDVWKLILCSILIISANRGDGRSAFATGTDR